MGNRVNVIGVGMVPFQKPGASESYEVMAEKAMRAALDETSGRVVQTIESRSGTALHALERQSGALLSALDQRTSDLTSALRERIAEVTSIYAQSAEAMRTALDETSEGAT